jgi:hypothetical protein
MFHYSSGHASPEQRIAAVMLDKSEAGRIYEGEWDTKTRKAEGTGSRTWLDDSDRHTEKWSDNAVVIPDAARRMPHVGGFKADRRHGQGVLSQSYKCGVAHYVLDGEWRDGHPDGVMVIKHHEDYQHLNPLRKGLVKEECVYRWDMGADGNPTGIVTGKAWWSDDRTSKGEWNESGVPHGRGIMSHPGGAGQARKEDGVWRDGVFFCGDVWACVRRVAQSSEVKE